MVAGLKCVLKTEAQEHIFCYPDTADYVTKITADGTPPYAKELSAVGRDRYNDTEYAATTRLTLAFTSGEGRVECYHNFHPLQYGGKHLDGAKDKILTYLQWHLCEKMSAEEMLSRLILIIDTHCPDRATRWENGAAKSIKNQMIADMVSDLINDDFGYYIKQNRSVLMQIFKIQEDTK